MATDFIEERKWKHAAAQFMGKLASASALQQQQHRKQGTSDAMQVDSDCINMNDTRENSLVVATAVLSSAPPNSEKSTLTLNVVEAGAAGADEATMRNVAKTLSQKVTALVLSAASPQPEKDVKDQSIMVDLTADGDKAGLALKQRAEENQNGLRSVSGQSECVPSSDSKAAALERASKFVQDVLDSLDGCGTDENDASSSTTDAIATGAPLNLLPSQSAVVRTVEDRWQRTGMGSILRGTVAAGKTVTTATLLWLHRAAGPQLLICSSASTVRLSERFGVAFDFASALSYGKLKLFCPSHGSLSAFTDPLATRTEPLCSIES